MFCNIRERSRREVGPFLLFFEDGEETAYLGVLLLDAFVEELDLGSEDIGAVGIILAVVDID